MKYNDPAAQELREKAKAEGKLPDKEALQSDTPATETVIDKVEEVIKDVVGKVEQVVEEAVEAVEDAFDGKDETPGA